ncbi:MAG: hypothetical protein AAFS10_13360 [Myxococcota bacterium]
MHTLSTPSVLAIATLIVLTHTTACVTEDAAETVYMTESALTEDYMLCSETEAVSGVSIKAVAVDDQEALVVPADGEPIGLILLLADQGESAHRWFDEQERLQFVVDAQARGFALVALEQRPSLAYQVKAHRTVARLQEEGFISTQTPLLGVGYRAGGDFLSALTQTMDFKAIMLAHTGGFTGLMEGERAKTMPPTWLATAARDNEFDADRMNTLAKSMRLEGVEVKTSTNVPAVIRPESLTPTLGIDCLLAQDIVRGLVAGRLLNTDGTLTENSTWFETIVQSTELNPKDPTDQMVLDSLDRKMLELYAGSVFSSDHGGFVLTFFQEKIDR